MLLLAYSPVLPRVRCTQYSRQRFKLAVSKLLDLAESVCLCYAQTKASALQVQILGLFCKEFAKFNPSSPRAAAQCSAELLAAGVNPAALTREGLTALDMLRLPACPEVKPLEAALEKCDGDPRTCLQLLFDHDNEGWLARRRLVHPRVRAILDHRRAHEARRDAALVFQAASEGRPLELAKRLRLGTLGGGLDIVQEARDDSTVGGVRLVSPLQAARLGGHTECASLIAQQLCLMGRGVL